MLESDEGKLSRPVLRRGSGSNPASLAGGVSPAHRKPPDVRICRLSIQSDVGTRPPSTSTPHLPTFKGPALVGEQVVEVRQAGEQRRMTPSWMMESFHGEKLAVDGVMGLIRHGEIGRAH